MFNSPQAKQLSRDMVWVPLESNPEVMTKFLHKLGVPKQWAIVDIYGLHEDLLALIPKPVLAVILLFPDNMKVGVKEDESTAKEEEAKTSETSEPGSVYHMKQFIPNACGTIALIHSVANNLDTINLQDGLLKEFLDATKDLSFSKRGEHLVYTQNIREMHEVSAQEGQTEAPGENVPVLYHFVALVHHNGVLYELDGRKPKPIEHGPTTPETLLEDAANVCKTYIMRDPDEVHFTMVALAAAAKD